MEEMFNISNFEKKLKETAYTYIYLNAHKIEYSYGFFNREKHNVQHFSFKPIEKNRHYLNILQTPLKHTSHRFSTQTSRIESNFPICFLWCFSKDREE